MSYLQVLLRLDFSTDEVSVSFDETMHFKSFGGRSSFMCPLIFCTHIVLFYHLSQNLVLIQIVHCPVVYMWLDENLELNSSFLLWHSFYVTKLLCVHKLHKQKFIAFSLYQFYHMHMPFVYSFSARHKVAIYLIQLLC